jgi:hypothetical protein
MAFSLEELESIDKVFRVEDYSIIDPDLRKFLLNERMDDPVKLGKIARILYPVLAEQRDFSINIDAIYEESQLREHIDKKMFYKYLLFKSGYKANQAIFIELFFKCRIAIRRGHVYALSTIKKATLVTTFPMDFVCIRKEEDKYITNTCQETHNVPLRYVNGIAIIGDVDNNRNPAACGHVVKVIPVSEDFDGKLPEVNCTVHFLRHCWVIMSARQIDPGEEIVISFIKSSRKVYLPENPDVPYIRPGMNLLKN